MASKILGDEAAEGEADECKFLQAQNSDKIIKLPGKILQRDRSFDLRTLAMSKQIVANDAVPARKEIGLSLPHPVIQAHPMEKDERGPPPRNSPECAVAQPETSRSQPIRHGVTGAYVPLPPSMKMVSAKIADFPTRSAMAIRRPDALGAAR
jgi:hypothetical protein